MNRRVYMDYAATTPVDPDVIRVMEPYFFEIFANPASPHGYGHEASTALESSRETIAQFIHAKSDEVIFVASATEAVNHVMSGMAHKVGISRSHIIVSAVEHHCVLGTAEHLAAQGLRVSICPVDGQGFIDLDILKSLIDPETVLIAVMHANNEIGTIQPVAEIGRIAREHKIPFLVDAAQSVGHVEFNVQEMNADFLVLAAHKFYGPKGVGALYIRSGVHLPPFLHGGGQEKGRRASTVNVAAAVGMAKALALSHERMPQETERLKGLRDLLIQKILSGIDGVVLNGHPSQRLAKNVHVSINGVKGEQLLMALDMAGIAASQGSACSVGTMKASHVLQAIGADESRIAGALRLTIGRWTTVEDIEYVADQLKTIVQRLRR